MGSFSTEVVYGLRQFTGRIFPSNRDALKEAGDLGLQPIVIAVV